MDIREPAAPLTEPEPAGACLLSTMLAPDPAPFPHTVNRTALPRLAYEALAASFPAVDLFAADAAQADNRVFRIASATVRDDPRFSATWKQFMAEHVSARFWQRLVRTFGDELRAQHPQLEATVGRPLHEWRVGRRGDEDCDVVLEALIVINSPVRGGASAVKGAHIDRADKLWTGLLYMRSEDDHTPGGALELYAGQPGLRFDRHQAPRRHVRLGKIVDYRANTFVGFVNGVGALHAVESRPNTPHIRRYVDFVAELPRGRLFAVPQLGRLQRTAYRLLGQREATR
jgi:hypothetical protein